MISPSGRFGTGQLCQGYIRLLTSLLDQLDLTVFSLPSLLLSLLLRRLLSLAGPQATLAGPQATRQQTSPWLSALVPQLAPCPARPQDLATLNTPGLVQALTSAHNTALDPQPLVTAVLDTWPRLAHHSYTPLPSLTSSRSLSSLTVATRAVLPKLSGPQLCGLLSSLHALLQQEQGSSCVSLAAVSLTRLALLLRPGSLPQALLTSIATTARARCSGALLGPLLSSLQGDLVSRHPELREQFAPRENSFQGSGVEVVGREGGLVEDTLALWVNRAGQSPGPTGESATEEEENSVEIIENSEVIKTGNSEEMVNLDVNSSDSDEIVQMDVLETGEVTGSAPNSKKARLSRETEVAGGIRRLQEEMRGLTDLLAQGRLQGDQRSSLATVREQISLLLGQE